MVKEVQLIVGPEDIKKFGLQCTKCRATVMLEVDPSHNFPRSCPNCLTSWEEGKSAERHRQFTELIRILHSMEQSPVRVRMVFDGEEV